MRQTRHLNWYWFPYSINLARPFNKGFEHLRPGVIGWCHSHARRREKVEHALFPLSSSSENKRRKIYSVYAVGIFMAFVLFSIVGLLVLFFGRWLHWVSRPSNTNHVNFQGEGNPKNSPPCCHGGYDLKSNWYERTTLGLLKGWYLMSFICAKPAGFFVLN